MSNKKKVVLVGCGMVGMSYAYALLNQNICEELVLIDIDKKRSIGEAMDLNHGLAFAKGNMKIYAGEYTDCHDASLVVICAGAPQKPGETRLDLLAKNTKILKSIVDPITESGFNGIFLVASNPVDILTRIVQRLSGFNPKRVIGSGTTLDTARLRYMLGHKLNCDPRNIHAYVIGEHGDSEFVPWSQAMMATKPILDVVDKDDKFVEELNAIEDEVRNSAYKIIEAKRATYYGIGMALCRITKAILDNEHAVLSCSCMLTGEYGEDGMYIGTPAIINSNGVQKVIELNITADERTKFTNSCHTLDQAYKELFNNK